MGERTPHVKKKALLHDSGVLLPEHTVAVHHTPTTPMRAVEAPRQEGRYRRVAVLEEHAQWRLWLGWDVALSRNVALREPSSAATTLRLRREAMLLARLEHPGIVAVHDLLEGEGEDEVLFVTALVQGVPLEAPGEVLDHSSDRHGAAARELRALAEVAEVVGHAHARGVVHRALRPSCLLCGEDGVMRVLDWSLAAARGEAGDALDALDTRAFLSPEASSGALADPREDVWSLGALLGWLLTGRVVEASEDLEVQPELAAVWRRCTHHDPQARYADAHEVARELRRWLDGRRVDAFDVSSARALGQVVWAWRRALALGSVVVLIVCASVAWGVARTRAEAARARDAEARANASASAANRALAEVQGRRAADAFEAGDLELAERLVARSLALHPLPRTRGLSMALAAAPRPRRELIERLPPCPRWRQGDDPSWMLCDNKADWRVWSKGKTLWTRATPSTALQDVRLEGQTIHALNGPRRIKRLDAWTGDLLGVDLRQGEFTHTRAPWRSALGGTASLQSGWPDAPCPHAVFRTLEDVEHERWIFACMSGGIWVVPRQGEPYDLEHARAREWRSLASAPDGSIWASTVRGEIVPVSRQAYGLAFGQPVEALLPIPGQPHHVVALGARGKKRILDVRHGRWVTSLPTSGLYLTLARDGGIWELGVASRVRWRLERAPRVAVYQAHNGLSSLSWSSDGEHLWATDGSGMIHHIEPHRGVIHAPIRWQSRVLKTIDASGEDVLVGGMEEIGLGRLLPGARQVTTAHQHPHAVRDVVRLHDGTTLFTSYARDIHHMSVDGRVHARRPGTQPPKDLDRSADRRSALLVSADGAWVWRGQGWARVAPARGWWAGAIRDDGMIALTRDGTLHVRDAEGQVLRRWRSPSPVLDMTWLARRDVLITGHLDGVVRLWDTRAGTVRAELAQHHERVSSVRVSPDGRWLASAGWDGAVRLSDLRALDESPEQVAARAATWSMSEAEADGEVTSP